MVCGNLKPDGVVEISNAGHLPPLLVNHGDVKCIEATGLPVGIFSSEKFSVERFQMQQGDTLFLFTDGFSEALDGRGCEYGINRLSEHLASNQGLAPKELIGNCLRELNNFRPDGLPEDDLTLMAIRRVQ